jgi:hypothetical protein
MIYNYNNGLEVPRGLGKKKSELMKLYFSNENGNQSITELDTLDSQGKSIGGPPGRASALN